jgi:hypothetical protein
MMLLQNQYSEAISLVYKFSMRGSAIPETTRLKAVRYVLEEAMKMEMEEQEACVVALLPASPGSDLPETSKISGLPGFRP